VQTGGSGFGSGWPLKHGGREFRSPSVWPVPKPERLRSCSASLPRLPGRADGALCWRSRLRGLSPLLCSSSPPAVGRFSTAILLIWEMFWWMVVGKGSPTQADSRNALAPALAGGSRGRRNFFLFGRGGLSSSPEASREPIRRSFSPPRRRRRLSAPPQPVLRPAAAARRLSRFAATECSAARSDSCS
jgi:hypothetical protein